MQQERYEVNVVPAAGFTGEGISTAGLLTTYTLLTEERPDGRRVVANPEVLWELCNSAICPFCFSPLPHVANLGDCPECTHPVTVPEGLTPIECGSCGERNPLPWPLQDAAYCDRCAARI